MESEKVELKLCDINLSSRLAELGINKESHFAYLGRGRYGYFLKTWTHDMRFGTEWTQALHAYTTCELGKMLPKEILVNNILYSLTIFYHSDDKYVQYVNLRDDGDGAYFHINLNTESDITEAYSRAKMLIWLIENKHITVAEINNNK